MTPKLCTAAVVVLGCAASAHAGDLVQKKDGTFNPPTKGGGSPAAADFEGSNWQITDATIEEITYSIPIGNPPKPAFQKLKASEVMDIYLEPKDYPQHWKEAVEAMTNGDYKRAADLFRAIGEEARVHKVVRQRAFLYAARALRDWGKVADADQAYDRLLAAFKDTFYARSLWKDRAGMWMDAGDEPRARSAAEKLMTLPGVSDSDKQETTFLVVTIDFRKAVTAKDQAGIQKALDAFKDIAGVTQGKKDLASVNALARIGQGNCLLELGKATEAKGIFEEISQAKGNEKAVDAAAFAGLGECWYRQGDAKGWEEARRCFLRTSLLYAEGASADLVARALYYAGDCFHRLQDSEDWKDRARRELDDCRRRFPTSTWADKAKKLLQAVPR